MLDMLRHLIFGEKNYLFKKKKLKLLKIKA